MFKNANKPLTIITLIILAIIIIPIAFAPDASVSLINTVYTFIVNEMAWFFLLMGFSMAIGVGVLIFSKYGDIRLGGKDAKPHFKTFTWISMNLCSALAAGVLIFGVCEWMYYINDTPFGIEPGSVAAYEYAASYGLFHWGFSAWAFYVIPGVAIGYLYWNKKNNSLQLSKLCGNILDGDNKFKKALKWVVDTIIVFGYFMAIMTTVGIGTPVLGELASDLLGIENSFAMRIAVLAVFGMFFTLSTSKNIAKGMGKISDFNVYLAIAFFVFVLFVGDTSFILNNLTMSIGTNIREFVRMSFNTDAVASTGFVQGWTIFYWAWYVALTFICGIWIARTSYGRTLREIAVANCVWAVLACWITFGILGNYGMAQELLHGLDISGQIGEIGNNGVTLMVLKTMPLPEIAVFIFMILIFFNLASTVTANSTSLSMYTSKGLKSDEEPNPLFKTFWSLLFLIIPVGVVFLERAVEGLNILSTIQSLITISSLPMLLALAVLGLSIVKTIKQDIKDGSILDSIDDNKKSKWSIKK